MYLFLCFSHLFIPVFILYLCIYLCVTYVIFCPQYLAARCVHRGSNSLTITAIPIVVRSWFLKHPGCPEVCALVLHASARGSTPSGCGQLLSSAMLMLNMEKLSPTLFLVMPMAMTIKTFIDL